MFIYGVVQLSKRLFDLSWPDLDSLTTLIASWAIPTGPIKLCSTLAEMPAIYYETQIARFGPKTTTASTYYERRWQKAPGDFLKHIGFITIATIVHSTRTVSLNS